MFLVLFFFFFSVLTSSRFINYNKHSIANNGTHQYLHVTIYKPPNEDNSANLLCQKSDELGKNKWL